MALNMWFPILKPRIYILFASRNGTAVLRMTVRWLALHFAPAPSLSHFSVTPLAHYYIARGNVFQCPDLSSMLAAKVVGLYS